MSNIYFTYPNGKSITYSVYWRFCNQIGRDHDEMKRIFYRARNADDPVTYISHGLKKGYIKQCCKDEYDAPGKVQAWIDQIIGKKKPEKRVEVVKRGTMPTELKDLIKDAL